MNNFTYRSAEERQSIEEVLRRRKRKFNMQQIISAVIFIIIVGTLLLYLAFHVYYTEYDGYVHVDANKVRTPSDIYLDSVYVKVGDIVAPGDTLYSYYIIDQLLEYANPNSEPTIVSRNRDVSIKYQSISSEVAVLRVKIEELKKEIALEDHNISFGLSQNSHKLDLQRQLNESTARLNALLRELWLLSNMRRQTTPSVSVTVGGRGHGHSGAQQIFDDKNSGFIPTATSYRLANDSSIVTDLMAPNHMVFFKKDEILTTQHLDLEGNNLQVIAYIPIDKMHRITNKTTADVVVNSDFSFKAHVEVLGMRTEVIPDHLRSYFSKKNTAIIAILKIDEGQTVPFWTMAEGLPVSVRVRNTTTWGAEPTAENYLWYTTGKGIKIDLPDEWNYRDHKAQIDSIEHARDSLAQVAREDSLARVARADSIARAARADSTVRANKSTKASQASSSSATVSQPVADGTTPYYVIVFSFKSEEKAQKQLELVRMTNPGADIIYHGGRYSGYTDKFSDRKAAQKYLNDLRTEKGMEGAWILDINTQE